MGHDYQEPLNIHVYVRKDSLGVQNPMWTGWRNASRRERVAVSFGLSRIVNTVTQGDYSIHTCTVEV